MTAQNRRGADEDRTEETVTRIGGTPQHVPTEIGGNRPADPPALSVEEQERRASLLDRLQEARKEIDEALAHLPPEDLERLEREWIEDVDEAIRQRAIRLIRQAS